MKLRELMVYVLLAVCLLGSYASIVQGAPGRDFTRHEELLSTLEDKPQFARACRLASQAIAAARKAENSEIERKYWIKAAEVLSTKESLTPDALELYQLCHKEERDVVKRQRLRLLGVVAMVAGSAGLLWWLNQVEMRHRSRRARVRLDLDNPYRMDYPVVPVRDDPPVPRVPPVPDEPYVPYVPAPPAPVIQYREDNVAKNAQMIENAFRPDADACSICLTGFEPGEAVATWNCSCGHVFHRECAEGCGVIEVRNYTSFERRHAGQGQPCPHCRGGIGMVRFSTTLPAVRPTRYLEDADKTRQMTAKAVIGGECPVCMEDFESGEEVVCWNCPCGFTVHRKDADSVSGGCPQCSAGAGEDRYRTVLK